MHSSFPHTKKGPTTSIKSNICCEGTSAVCAFCFPSAHRLSLRLLPLYAKLVILLSFLRIEKIKAHNTPLSNKRKEAKPQSKRLKENRRKEPFYLCAACIPCAHTALFLCGEGKRETGNGKHFPHTKKGPTTSIKSSI